MLINGGGINHGLRVSNVAVTQHARELVSGYGQDEGFRARRQNQAVVFGADGIAGSVSRVHDAVHAVDGVHAIARMQMNTVIAVPRPIVQNDLVQRLFARQNGREQDAVVVGVRLIAKHGDVVKLGRDLQQFFDCAHTGHAVAHHD